MTDPFTRFDRDPDALAWARSKVQAEVDRAQAFGKEAAAVHDPEQSEVWRRLANRMQRVLVGGKGCVHGAFDERLPELVAEIDALRAAEPTAPAADELAPPAPQEPTVTDRTPAQTLTAAAEKLRTLAAAASTDTDGAPTAAWSTKPCGPEKTDGSSRLYGDFLTREDGRRIAWPPLLHGGSQQRLAHMRTRHAAYIAAMDPGVGVALADWLEVEAELHADDTAAATGDGSDVLCENFLPALAVARQILGEASQ